MRKFTHIVPLLAAIADSVSRGLAIVSTCDCQSVHALAAGTAISPPLFIKALFSEPRCQKRTGKD